jgi:hypothetical protein
MRFFVGLQVRAVAENFATCIAAEDSLACVVVLVSGAVRLESESFTAAIIHASKRLLHLVGALVLAPS